MAPIRMFRFHLQLLALFMYEYVRSFLAGLVRRTLIAATAMLTCGAILDLLLAFMRSGE